MSRFRFTPEPYLEMIRSEIPAFDEFQERVADASYAMDVVRILELGTGSGETARRVLERHPAALLVGVDASAEMLAAALEALPARNIESLVVRGIEDELPKGPFDLVVSALTIHHLDDPGKADLFDRVARVLRPGGRLVMGDVVVPDDPASASIPLTPDYDQPSPTEDLEGWLRGAGFSTEVVWRLNDLAVVVAERPE